MRQMLQIMKARLLAGEDLVMVTVTASSGATPRGAGARMLVGKAGRICGTIGGGAVEYRSEGIAKTVLEEKSSRGHDFTLTREDVLTFVERIEVGPKVFPEGANPAARKNPSFTQTVRIYYKFIGEATESPQKALPKAQNAPFDK